MTAEEEAKQEIEKILEKYVGKLLFFMGRKWMPYNYIADKIIAVSQRYVERKIDERLDSSSEPSRAEEERPVA